MIKLDLIDIETIIQEEERMDIFHKAKDIEKTYILVMNEERNRNLSQKGQEELVRGIIEIQSKNPTAKQEDVWQSFSSIGHMDYYDNFLQQGEKDNIINALKEKNIPLTVLEGVAKGQPVNIPVDVVGIGKVTVIQEIERDESNSPVISLFQIKLNNETIYKWDKRKIIKLSEEEERLGIIHSLKSVVGRNGRTYYFFNGKFAKKEMIERYFK